LKRVACATTRQLSRFEYRYGAARRRFASLSAKRARPSAEEAVAHAGLFARREVALASRKLAGEGARCRAGTLEAHGDR
jgi:hypothetical protein